MAVPKPPATFFLNRTRRVCLAGLAGEGELSDQLTKVIEGFPECVALGVEGEAPSLKYACEYIHKEWDMDAPVDAMILAKKPKLLGNT
eukprot:1108168-Pyramimonas_sp.AAC.1